MNDNQHNHRAALIEDLLAAPFIAAADANTKMAQEQVKFLIETCFDANGDSFSPKMISMSILKKKQLQTESDELVTFELPLITVIPFNSLCVKDINVKFDMEIVSLAKNENDNDSHKKNIELRGSVATSKGDENLNKKQQKMQVELTGGSIPLPVGLTTILKFFSNNIQLKS